MTLNFKNIVIVLKETISAGNIGSTARAMTNMGLSELRLVQPKANHLDDQACKLAHGCHDFLKEIKVFTSLKNAVEDCSLLVATSHKIKRDKRLSLSARELGKNLIPYCINNKVAILFGREDFGLSNEDINLCSWLVNIPTARPYPALNLAQAVMVICYELFMTQPVDKCREFSVFITYKELENFLDFTKKYLNNIGFRHKNDKPEIFIGKLRRLLSRVGIQKSELNTLYKLFRQFDPE